MSPLPHQQEALGDLRETFNVSDRAQLISACGTGKTLTGWWATQELLAAGRANGLVLVVVPSLLLVGQTYDAWAAVADTENRPFEPFVVCSDPSTTAGREERGGGQTGFERGTPLASRASTDAAMIATRIARRPKSRPLVLFSTYHSLPRVFDAVESSGCRIDLAVFDEAHRLVRGGRTEWLGALDDAVLPVGKRLFMTATQIITPADSGTDAEEATAGRPAVSMGDDALFGPVAHRLSFSEAVRRKLLVDIEVLVVGHTTDSRCRDTQVPEALLAAVGRGASRVLTFHGRVAKAKHLADAVDGRSLPDGRTITSTWVDGTMPMSERISRLQGLDAVGDNEVRVVTNARCLTEGVDVPAVDGVVFADPKATEVDTVQAVGRAMRTAEGKSKGYIVIPLVIDGRVDTDSALSSSDFAVVWRTLRQIAEVDDSLAEEFIRFQRDQGEDRSTPSIPRSLSFVLPDGVDAAQLTGQIADKAMGQWHKFYGLLTRYVSDEGTTLGIASSYRTAAGDVLGMWVRYQRMAYARGALTSEKVTLLEALPDWGWDRAEAAWMGTYRSCLAAVKNSESGSIGAAVEGRDEALATRRLRLLGQRGVGKGTNVEKWAAHQRIALRRDELTETQAELLRALPGWRDTMVDPADGAMVDLLGEYVAWKHDANPPSNYVMDDVPLGAWLDEIRTKKATGRLDRSLETEIRCVTPAQNTSAGALRWRTREALWLFKYETLRRYVEQHGSARLPWKHVEVVDGYGVPLSDWCRNQRHLHRRGELPAGCVKALEAIPGWLWEVSTRDTGREVLSGVTHGRRAAYVKGCGCDDCLAANRNAQAERDRMKAAGIATTDLVPVADARRHLLALVDQGASVKGIARASQINPKTVTGILDGTRKRVLPDTNEAIRTLTLAAVEDAAQEGTRVDATRTWELLDDLIGRGWPKAWIARELGRDGVSLQLSRVSVTAQNARLVAELHRRLDGVAVPRRRVRKPLPTLAELEAQSQRDRLAS